MATCTFRPIGAWSSSGSVPLAYHQFARAQKLGLSGASGTPRATTASEKADEKAKKPNARTKNQSRGRSPLAPDSPSFWARANWWYANGTDPLLLHAPIGLKVQVAISAFVFGPFYLLLVYAFVAGRDWIRMPAIVYVSAMTYGMVLLFGAEFLGDLPPTNVPKFL